MTQINKINRLDWWPVLQAAGKINAIDWWPGCHQKNQLVRLVGADAYSARKSIARVCNMATAVTAVQSHTACSLLTVK